MNPILKWNAKHSDRLNHLEKPLPNPRLIAVADYLKGGTALDLACGLGGNSFFLAQKGYQVQSLDISAVAVTYIQEQAVTNNLPITAKLADLTALNQLKWPNQSYDIIVMTYYLDRLLFPVMINILKKNGYLFIETYYQSLQTEKQGISNQYKLKPKELLVEFGNGKVLFYEENEHDGRQTIFCQK